MAPPNIQLFLHRLLSIFMHPLMMCALLIIVFLLVLAILKQPNNSTSVEESISLFYRHLNQRNWNMVWAHLSPKLRAELLNAQRPAIAKRGEAGIQQIEQMLAHNQHIFANFAPRMISKHLVPLASEHLQMLMVHTRISPGTPIVTLWLVRSLHSQGHWFVEEFLIHPIDKQNQPYTLSGKRFGKKDGQTEDKIKELDEGETEEENREEEGTEEENQEEEGIQSKEQGESQTEEHSKQEQRSAQATTGTEQMIKDPKQRKS